MKTKKPSVIWAIDPFETETRPKSSAARELAHWVRKAGFSLLPVHLLSVPRIDYGPENENTWVSRYVPLAKRSVIHYLENLGIAGIRHPRVLLDHSSSRKKAVQRLLQLADEVSSPFIVVSSHGRSGLERLAFGSFAENLLRESRRPVVFLSHAEEAPKLHRALFPTDFTNYSKEAFKRFLPQAKCLGAEVILFHAVALPSALISGNGLLGIASTVPENFFADQANWARKEGARWVSEAARAGVAARLIVNEEPVTPHVPRLILRIAREMDVGLIAMATVGSAFTALIAGSVAKDVFRASSHTVWVCGPKLLEEAASPSSHVPAPDASAAQPVSA